MGVPTFYTRLLDEPAFNTSVCQNMRLFISGSAPLLEQTFEDFEPGIDYFEGIADDHEANFANMKYPQYKWDQRSTLYYIDDEGMLVQRVNQDYAYPTNISGD